MREYAVSFGGALQTFDAPTLSVFLACPGLLSDVLNIESQPTG